MATFVVYCPRCDKAFTSEKSRRNAIIKLGAHVKKHPDYVPELHDEIDGPQ